MHRFSVAGACLLITTLAIINSPKSSHAETVWSAIGGNAHWGVSELSFNDYGIAIEIDGAAPNADGVFLSVATSPDFTLTTDQGQLQSIEHVAIGVSNRIAFTGSKGEKYDISGLRIIFVPDLNGGASVSLAGELERTDITLFTAADSKIGFHADTDLFKVETGNLQLTSQFASILGLSSKDVFEFPGFEFSVQLDWAGGDEPFVPDPTTGPLGAPRGGNNGTICGVPGGPDVMVGLLYTDGFGENEASQQINGVWYDSFSAGTTSCNLGDQNLTWNDDNGSVVHPVIGQNVFRLHNGRLEQIGQSWLKHGFTALTQNECGCGCSGAGGNQLPPGCSDPYSPGLNNSQNSIKPKFRVNPTTGIHFHGSNPGFSGSVARRLRVRHTDISPTLNPGARFFIEGQYIQQEDAAIDVDDNNASHREISITPSGSNEYNYAMMGQTIREQPAIRSWQTIDPTVVLSDAKTPNDGLFIVGSKASDNGDGTWHFEYAVHNLNSNRGARSFSIPVGSAAAVFNFGFHDVDYNDGDGEGSVSRNGTDWTPSVTDGVLTWTMNDIGDNSNALLWGTMYNFRFDASVGPESELGTATMDFFRAQAGQADSFTAAVIVPIPAAILIEVEDGALPSVISNCEQTSFEVRIAGNSETLDPATVKLHYSYDGGAFQEQSLTPLGGEMYEVALPTPQCGDSPRLFLSATSTIGTTVTYPEDAEANESFLTAFVGVEAENTVIETTDFENGLPVGWSQTGLWNVGSSCSDIPNGACLDSDGSNAAYYGQPSTCNYDTGLVQQGSMFTPEFLVPSGTSATLTYCSSFERHTFPGGDKPIVRVIPQGGSPEIVDEPSLGIVVSTPPVWTQRTVDLTAYNGQTISIEWNFDNLIAIDDDYMGWLVDNVRVTAVVPECVPGCADPDGDLNLDTAANGVDIQLFATAIIDQSTNPIDLQHADFDGSGTIDLGDVSGMVGKLLE